MTDEVTPLENIPVRQTGLSKTLKPTAIRGLRVDTKTPKAFARWHEILLENKGPASRSHCLAWIYKERY